MTVKTITLNGSEVSQTVDGCNAWLRNDGTATVYAAAAPGVTAGADGVVSIPAGGAAPVYGVHGTVYLMGTGSVQLIGSDFSACPFKLTSTTAAGTGTSGGSGVTPTDVYTPHLLVLPKGSIGYLAQRDVEVTLTNDAYDYNRYDIVYFPCPGLLAPDASWEMTPEHNALDGTAT